MTTCQSCRRMKKRDAGTAPIWDNMYRSQHWDIVHAYNTSWLGWLVLVLRRHAEAIDELTESEAGELGNLLLHVSVALKRETGCAKTYVMQFAESPAHPHVHFHVVPRRPDQAAEDISWRVLRHLGVDTEAACSEADMTALAGGIRLQLQALRC